MNIRPEIQALIDRAAAPGGLPVEISEIEHFDCNPVESQALIPALSNSALARRIDRTIANLPVPSAPAEHYSDALYFLGVEAMRRLERL